MPYLSDNDKLQFLQEGYLVLPDVISPEMIAETRDALWAGIRADRDNPATWINAEPRMPVTPEHPAMQAVVNDSPVFGIAEELAVPTLRALRMRGAKAPHETGENPFPAHDEVALASALSTPANAILPVSGAVENLLMGLLGEATPG